MKITTGFGYDGRHPNNIGNSFNMLWCGPNGLVNELEFRSGIVTPQFSKAARIVEYLGALQKADTPARFYHDSFATDPLSCAETLLSWRDFAIDHGWDPVPGAGSPGRLGDLADVEDELDGFAPGTRERVISILRHASLIAGAIEEIALHDSRALWPVPFQTLFDGLEQAGITITEVAPSLTPGAPESSDLGRLQRALMSDVTPIQKLALSSDDTLRMYHCLDSHAGANYVSALLAQTTDHLLIASEQQHLLNCAAVSRAIADPGLGERSYWRAPTQLLPLLLQCAWSPPSAETLLQYLSLPTGPLRGLRRAIARHFADLPGYDATEWQHIADRFVAQRISNDPSTDESKLRQSIDTWLTIGAAGNDQQMARDLAIELAEQVKTYWRARFNRTTDPAEGMPFIAAYEAAEALADALRGWSSSHISKDQLNRLLDIASDAGSATHHHPRQVSTLNLVDSPEGSRLSVGPMAHLVWWGVSLEEEVRVPPFDELELAAIPDAPDDVTLSHQRAECLRRALEPLIAARQSTILITLDETPDLLRLHLEQYVGSSAWDNLEEGLITGTLNEVSLVTISDLPLPVEQRWWKLDTPIQCPRPKESYSGLSTLALKPHEYTFKYVARLSEGSIVELPVDARLKGNLAHKIVEHWFTEQPWTGALVTRPTIDQWLDNRFDSILAEVALPLAAPGQRAEKLQFRDTIAHAMEKLLGHLHQAGVASAHIEYRLNRSLAATELEGTLDVLGQLPDGRSVIIDMKWSSEKRYCNELREGLYLQLATYAHLAEAPSPGQVAEVGYFILRSGNLLCTSNLIFKDTRVVPALDPSVTPATVWASLQSTTDWRCSQLSTGEIEVTYGKEQPTSDSEPPLTAIPLLEMEEAILKAQRNSWGRKPTFKRVNPWQVITGQIKEQQ